MNGVFLVIGVLLLICLVGGVLFGYVVVCFCVQGDLVVEQVNVLLLQIQCGQCGYFGCKFYVEVIVVGDKINKCLLGGEVIICVFVDLFDLEFELFDVVEEILLWVVYICEVECIGCIKCIQVCLVDVIVGVVWLMYMVIVDECIGCDLCLEFCLVDCIEMCEILDDVCYWKWLQLLL